MFKQWYEQYEREIVTQGRKSSTNQSTKNLKIKTTSVREINNNAHDTNNKCTRHNARHDWCSFSYVAAATEWIDVLVTPLSRREDGASAEERRWAEC